MNFSWSHASRQDRCEAQFPLNKGEKAEGLGGCLRATKQFCPLSRPTLLPYRFIQLLRKAGHSHFGSFVRFVL